MLNRARGRARQAVRWGLLLAAALGLVVALPACQQLATPPTGSLPAVTIDEILADPQRFMDQTVAASANVAQVVGQRVIVLQSQIPGQQMVAVLGDQAAQNLAALQPGDAIRLVGTVRPISREEIQQAEQQLGIQLDEEQVLILAGQAPFVVVQSASRL